MANSDSNLRRGLPRCEGGDPWPAPTVRSGEVAAESVVAEPREQASAQAIRRGLPRTSAHSRQPGPVMISPARDGEPVASKPDVAAEPVQAATPRSGTTRHGLPRAVGSAGLANPGSLSGGPAEPDQGDEPRAKGSRQYPPPRDAGDEPSGDRGETGLLGDRGRIGAFPKPQSTAVAMGVQSRGGVSAGGLTRRLRAWATPEGTRTRTWRMAILLVLCLLIPVYFMLPGRVDRHWR